MKDFHAPRIVALAAVLVAALPACGGSDDDNNSLPQHRAEAPADLARRIE